LRERHLVRCCGKPRRRDRRGAAERGHGGPEPSDQPGAPGPRRDAPGIPDEFFETSGTYETTPEQRVEWEADVRSLYDGTVRIVVMPTWAKLIDFETTLPSAVEELVRRRDERQRG
jgi:hypothetical protein